jgi:hypothetical protein
MYMVAQMCEVVEPYSLELFTAVLQYSVEDALALFEGVRKDMQNKEFHMYANFYFVYGQKPEETPAA